MIRFKKFTTYQEAHELYYIQKNSHGIEYEITEKEFKSIRVNDEIIIGHCEGDTVYAIVKKLELKPRPLYSPNSEFKYYMTIEMLAYDRIVFLKPYNVEEEIDGFEE